MMNAVAPRVAETPGTSGARTSISRYDRALEIIDERLGEAPFFAGDMFTAADIMMRLTRVFAKRDLTSYQGINTYMQRIMERPAAQRAMARAEPDGSQKMR
jgi:glutathione S-transferase